MAADASRRSPLTQHAALTRLIDSYLVSVSEAFSAFLDAGLCHAPGSHVEWAANGIAHNGDIEGGGHYQKLSFGLHINRNGLSVAFDFGKEGQTNEFDAYRLSQYWSDNHTPGDFRSVRDLETAFQAAIEQGHVRVTASQKYQLAARQ